MKLLTRTFATWQRLFHPTVLFTASLLGLGTALEIVGRQLPNDLFDAMAASLVGMVVLLIAARHRQAPVGWVQALGEVGGRALGLLRRLTFEIGIDLRGQPPLPHRFPPLVLTLLFGLGAWAVLLLAFPGAFPHIFRNTLGQVFYLGYLTLMIGLWAALLFALVVAVFLPTAMIHDALVGAYQETRRRSRHRELIGIALYFFVLGMAGMFLPPWVGLVVCLLALAVNLLTIALPSNPDVQFIWRYKDSPQIHAVSWGRWVTCEFALLTLVIVNLVLTAFGGVALTGSSVAREVMPMTTLLGLALSWLAPGALTALIVQTILGRLRDPARSRPRVVHIQGVGVAENRKVLTALFAERGWQVRFAPAAAEATDVAIELVEPSASFPEEEACWPLRLGLAALGREEVMARLERRDEIQKRRRLVSGLELLFKRAARRRYHSGSGFWVAPHYWFITGLSRDTPEDEFDLEEGTILSGTIGPFYYRVLPQQVRHHLYQMMRALQIDLIFVEDGVGFRRFVRVLRMMFEHYDIFGGRRRADEIHFRGVPGTRVLIHEYQLTEPFKSDVYPEPDYENLGRARILHVFRDRGEQEEPLETPLDFTFTPVPSLAR